MMIEVRLTQIHEHTVDLSLLPEKANILDLGCRGFQFADYFSQAGHNVCCVDCDLLRTYGRDYHWLAITDYDGRCGVIKSNDPNATRIGPGNDVKAMTLDSFSKMVGVWWWDVIKMDVEGSEYQIIMSMKKPMAKQLSIEFHKHLGQTEDDIFKMVGKLFRLGYSEVQHKEESRHGLPANYWDSLFVYEE